MLEAVHIGSDHSELLREQSAHVRATSGPPWIRVFQLYVYRCVDLQYYVRKVNVSGVDACNSVFRFGVGQRETSEGFWLL